MTAGIRLIALVRPTFDTVAAASRIDRASALLDEIGATRDGPPVVAAERSDLDGILERTSPPDVTTVVLQATFTDASMLVRISERTNGPIVVWSFPEERTGDRLRLNSLCGANLAAFSLRRRFHHARFVHVDPDAADAAARVGAALRAPCTPDPVWPEPATATIPAAVAAADRVVRALDGARIGVIGSAPLGFEPCAFDPGRLAGLTGATTEAMPLDSLFAAADDTTDREFRDVAVRVDGALVVDDDVRTHGLPESLRLYCGMRRLATEHGWSGLATRCWPECTTQYGGAACAPQAMMSADGVPAMCEADVYGTVTALILRSLGAEPFVADLADVNREDNTSVMWHCGLASLGLAAADAPPEGIVHPNQGRALLHQFALREGRVTVARLSQAGGRTSLVVGSGEMLGTARSYRGTSGVLRWDLPVDDVLATIFAFGLEHHYGIAYGEHRDAVVALAARWGIPVIRLGHDGTEASR